MRWMTGWMGMLSVMLGSMPVAAAPFAWIVNQGSGSVSRIDLATHLSVTTAVGEFPFGIAPVPDGSRAYVGNAGDASVSFIDATTMTVITTVPLVDAPQGLAVTPDGAKVYAARLDGFVDVIDTTTATVPTSIDLRGNGSALLTTVVMNAAGTHVYVNKLSSPIASIAVIDTATDAVVADVFLSDDGGFPFALTVSADGSRVYQASDYPPGVRVVDATTNLLIDELPLSCAPSCSMVQGIVTSLDGSLLYVALDGGIAVIDTATGAELTSIPLASNPSGLDITPDGTRIYGVASSGHIPIVDTATNTSIGTLLAVGTFPTGFGRFIVPGVAGTTTTSSSTTTSTSTSTTTSTVPPVPVLSTAARSCLTAIAGSWKKYPVKIHKLFTGCYDRVLRDVASGAGTSGAAASCMQTLNPASASSALARARSAARVQLLGRCGALTPAQVAQPCSPTATTIAEVADCVLDRQAEYVAATVAAQYGASCSIATAAGLTTLFPTLCGP